MVEPVLTRKEGSQIRRGKFETGEENYSRNNRGGGGGVGNERHETVAECGVKEN